MWINGRATQETYAHVAELVEALGYPAGRIAVERNGELVPRKAWADTALEPEDRVEIVQFVGGG